MGVELVGVISAPHRSAERRPGRGAVQLGAVRVSAVIPVLNEARNLPHVLPRLPEEVSEVVIVDGGSTDDTADVARRLHPAVRVISQDRRGKGNALACGFRACEGDIIVALDGDGSTDPVEIPRFLRALLAGADFAKGSRFMAGGGSHDITTIRRLGNDSLCRVVNGLYGCTYTDLCYGYNAFWRHALPALGYADAASGSAPRWGDGFEVETLLNVRAANAGLRVVEVPSVEGRRLHGASNLNAVRDGLRILGVIAAEHRLELRGTSAASIRQTPVLELPSCNEHAAAVACCCPQAIAA